MRSRSITHNFLRKYECDIQALNTLVLNSTLVINALRDKDHSSQTLYTMSNFNILYINSCMFYSMCGTCIHCWESVSVSQESALIQTDMRLNHCFCHLLCYSTAALSGQIKHTSIISEKSDLFPHARRMTQSANGLIPAFIHSSK